MATDTQTQLHGPEIVGMRINVYHLFPDFLDPTQTEEKICRSYNLTPEQVAAARAYVFHNFDAVLAVHREIEARIAVGNPPEVNEQIERSHQRLLRYRQWMDEREEAKSSPDRDAAPRQAFPTFTQWLAAKVPQPVGDL